MGDEVFECVEAAMDAVRDALRAVAQFAAMEVGLSSDDFLETARQTWDESDGN